MSRYRRISVRMWGDSRFAELSPMAPSGQGLWIYLLTNPETTAVPGAMRLGEAGIAEALGWELKAFREAFRELSEKGLVEADWKARFVWVPKACKHNPPASPNVIKGWVAHWEELPECELKTKALRGLRQHVGTMSKGFQKAFTEAFAEDLGESGSGTGAGSGTGSNPPTPPRKRPPQPPRTQTPAANETQPEKPPVQPSVAGGEGGVVGVPVRVPVERMRDYDPVPWPQVEEAISQAGLGGPVGSGAIGAALAGLKRPIYAWELRQSVAEAKGRRARGPGYVRKIIEGYRTDGTKPSPAPLPPGASTPKPDTVGEMSERRRHAWARAVREAGLPADRERIERMAEVGDVTPDDVEGLRAADGSWEVYDARTEEARREAHAAMERLGLAV